jgi:hypothetical protein
LLVTTVAPSAAACAAVNVSSGPIGVLAVARSGLVIERADLERRAEMRERDRVARRVPAFSHPAQKLSQRDR